MADTIAFKLNDKPIRLEVDGNRTLLWVLRTDLGLTGTKFGCGEGHCGACTVLVNGAPTRSCLLKVKDIQGKEVVTIEGLARRRQAAPAPEGVHGTRRPAMRVLHAGHDPTGVGLLQANPQPTREQIIRGMDHNLCRCGAHKRIIEAVQSAAAEMRGGS